MAIFSRQTKSGRQLTSAIIDRRLSRQIGKKPPIDPALRQQFELETLRQLTVSRRGNEPRSSVRRRASAAYLEAPVPEEKGKADYTNRHDADGDRQQRIDYR